MFYNPAASAANGGIEFVDKGDPGGTWDFSIGDLTKDGTWYDLDLSGIIGEGASWVLIRVEIGGAQDNIAFFRKNGYTGDIGQAGMYCDPTSKVADFVWCAVDGDRKIEYKLSATLTGCNMEVVGWVV